MRLSRTARVAILVVVGLSIAILGLMFYVFSPVLIKQKILDELVLKEGSQSYKNWKNVPVPIYIKFYFFNFTNPYEVVQNISKPILEEIGPYTFRESREKVKISINANGTVSYRQIKRWYFRPDLTNGSLDDEIVTANIPVLAAAAKLQAVNSPLMYRMLNGFLRMLKSQWYVKKPVRQLLFEGYRDPLIIAADIIYNFPYDKFGWFYERNGTDDGEFTIFTGTNGIQNVGKIYTWNGSSFVNNWNPPCDMINGSAGDIWPPNLKQDKKISMFVTDICRSISFTYLRQREIKKIKAYRFWADNTVLDNGKINPANKCFCKTKCLPSGAQNVSSCKLGAPVVVSYPHFLFADSTYVQGVIGLKPDPARHKMYIDIEPTMGIPLNVAARMQINVILDKIPQLDLFSKIPKRIYLPVFWFSETATIEDDMASKLKFVIQTVPLIATVLSFFLVFVGTLFMLSSFVLALLYATTKKITPCETEKAAKG